MGNFHIQKFEWIPQKGFGRKTGNAWAMLSQDIGGLHLAKECPMMKELTYIRTPAESYVSFETR